MMVSIFSSIFKYLKLILIHLEIQAAEMSTTALVQEPAEDIFQLKQTAGMKEKLPLHGRLHTPKWFHSKRQW